MKRLYWSILVFGICIGLLLNVMPAHAEPFSVSVGCPNTINYAFTNDTNSTNQYFITITDSANQGLASTAYTAPMKTGDSVPGAGSGTASLSFTLVKLPAPGNLTATLWRVGSTGTTTNVASVSLQNCWPASLSTPGAGGALANQFNAPANSRLAITCGSTGIKVALSDQQGRVVSRQLFTNLALLAAGAPGITRSLNRYGTLSVAGSLGWNSYYYYAAWNGGILSATGRNEFSQLIQCPLTSGSH